MKHVIEKKKERDKAVIEALVRSHGPVSRAGIRQLTQLRWSSVSPIVRELLNQGKLVEVGPSTNPMGRKQTLLRLNEENGYIVAVEFDPETVSAAVTDLFPRIRSKVTETTRVDEDANGLIHQLFLCAHEAIRQAGIPRDKLLGIGVADPGLVDVRQGVSVLSAHIGFWKNVHLKKLFEAEFGVPVILDSSTRAQALAERVRGAGEGAGEMIYIEYGRGIGAGIIIEGKCLLGNNSFAGEFGHIPMIENGPACSCGSFGCLEAIVGLSAMEARCRKAIQEGSNTRALEIAHADPTRITGWIVLQAAKLGDKTCLAIVGELEKYLGLGISTLVNLFNPSIIILDHRLGLAGDSLLDQIAQRVKRQALGSSTANLKFRYGTLGRDAGLLGAALNILERIFEIPALKPPRFMIESSVIDSLAGYRRALTENENSQEIISDPLALTPSR